MTILKKIDMDTTGMYFDIQDFPIVHSSMTPNSTYSFYGTDNQEDYLKNLDRLPSDWYYRNNTIEYRFNDVGLRMDSTIDKTEYIIGFGCSHTVGVGVNLSDTWIHKLGEKLNIDYINCGVSGGSSKLCAINFFNMLNRLKHLPKLVVFSWPSSVRYCLYTDNQFVFYLPRFINEKMFVSNIYKNMIMTDTLGTEFMLYRNMVKTTCDRLNIKFCEFSFDGEDKVFSKLNIKQIYKDPNNKDLNMDHARDVRDKSNNGYFSHPGIMLHSQACDFIHNSL